MPADLVRVDAAARQAWLGDRLLVLNPLTFDLLAYLVTQAGDVISPDQIMREVWKVSRWPNLKTLTVTMGRVRDALGDDYDNPTYITTIRGRGYRFEAAMVAPAETRVVDVDGRRYDVVHWEKHPYRGADVTFTLHAREAVSDGS
jgi:DNA-binding winged helix-turn-helix (wHTH) protein